MTLDDMKKVVRHHIDLTWNKGRMALAEQMHSKTFLYKSSFVGRPLNSAAFVQMVVDIRKAMPGLEVVIEECLAEGNKVFSWSTLIGTIEKSALGYPVSDKVLSISAMACWTLNSSGEIEELCTMFDMESFRAQLGMDSRPYAEIALP
ncbi:ester cyclase [Pseudomonas sp. UL073]|uniref:Ester cyclase n=1 Tax=Zestomonas insulae TaxID=2809017 RepID=A0ABS2IB10_9GAMM|nr:ketosteroid isomerase-related protein [Pseudomonas insulae]MBM7060152.1 ester cyclase [Pseudomonas insulae]